MTEQELEIIRANLRIEVLKICVSGLYTAVAGLSPSFAPKLLEILENLRQESSKIVPKGFPPEYSDLISGELQEAFSEILDMAMNGLKKYIK